MKSSNLKLITLISLFIFSFNLSAKADPKEGPKGPYIIATGSKFNSAYNEDFEFITSNSRKYEKTLSLCKRTEYLLISKNTPTSNLPKKFDQNNATNLTSEVLTELSKSKNELIEFENLCRFYFNFKLIGKHQRPECLTVIEASKCVRKLNVKISAGMIINQYKTSKTNEQYSNFDTHQFSEFKETFTDLKTINSEGQNPPINKSTNRVDALE